MFTKLAAWSLFVVLPLVACGASLDGREVGKVDDPTCSTHLKCGTFCCTEANASGEDWECGGTWPDCPANACCFTGQDVGPGDPNADVMGGARHKRAVRIVRLSPIVSR